LRDFGRIAALLLLSGLTICVRIPVVSVVTIPQVVPASGTFEKYGPRVYDLLFIVWGDVISEAMALENGEIDVMDSLVPPSYVEDWLADPEITMEEYSDGGYVAHRTHYGDIVGEEEYAGRTWEGFVNEVGVGFQSFWTHLNVNPQGFEKGGVLRQGLIEDVWSFNPVRTNRSCDWLVLSKIYEPLIKKNPYYVNKRIPWLCRNWTIGTWQFEGENCTKITFNLKFKNFLTDYIILWHDNQLFTAEDVAFTLQYMKDNVSPPFYQYVEKLDHVEAIDEYTVTAYYQVQSTSALDWAGSVPIIPKHIWEGKDPWIWNPEDYDAVIGTGPFMCKKDGVVGRPDFTFEYVHLDANPAYYRNYIWPDVCDETHTPGSVDGWVDLDDIMEMWDEPCDVNKDGKIDTEDLLEFCLHLAEPWPPPWWTDCNLTNGSKSIDMKTASAESLPVIYVSPEISHCPVGSNFTINIDIANVTTENSENGVYGWQVFMSFNPSLIEVTDIMWGPWLDEGSILGFSGIANDAGIVVLLDFVEWPETGVVGSGILANVTFNVLAEGKCSLHLYQNKLRTYDGTDILVIDHTTVDGIFTITGDVNGDGDVDASDLFALSKAYGSELGDPNWDSYCDFNGDDKADASDLFDLGKNYGKIV